tara:strand:- start:3158 stop:3436 length:279 start_codon:yes stop_codon:yes gene_type:complete
VFKNIHVMSNAQTVNRPGCHQVQNVMCVHSTVGSTYAIENPLPAFLNLLLCHHPVSVLNKFSLPLFHVCHSGCGRLPLVVFFFGVSADLPLE